jgi:hypothetical protein
MNGSNEIILNWKIPEGHVDGGASRHHRLQARQVPCERHILQRARVSETRVLHHQAMRLNPLVENFLTERHLGERRHVGVHGKLVAGPLAIIPKRRLVFLQGEACSHPSSTAPIWRPRRRKGTSEPFGRRRVVSPIVATWCRPDKDDDTPPAPLQLPLRPQHRSPRTRCCCRPRLLGLLPHRISEPPPAAHPWRRQALPPTTRSWARTWQPRRLRRWRESPDPVASTKRQGMASGTNITTMAGTLVAPYRYINEDGSFECLVMCVRTLLYKLRVSGARGEPYFKPALHHQFLPMQPAPTGCRPTPKPNQRRFGWSPEKGTHPPRLGSKAYLHVIMQEEQEIALGSCLLRQDPGELIGHSPIHNFSKLRSRVPGIACFAAARGTWYVVPGTLLHVCPGQEYCTPPCHRSPPFDAGARDRYHR